MNLTEWVTQEDLSIKEFTQKFVDVVKDNFGKHNYKHVTYIVNKELGNESKSQKLAIPNVIDQRELLIKYQIWYWRELQGKPCQTSASDVVDSFDE